MNVAVKLMNTSPFEGTSLSNQSCLNSKLAVLSGVGKSKLLEVC